jgi:dihydropteroate synthase
LGHDAFVIRHIHRMLFRARQFEFVFPRPTLVMGIVNVTPDSFSDGGKYLDTEAAVRHALELVAQGADILDIGGESSRPGAEPVAEAEELRRVIPVIQTLVPRLGVPVSVDTAKPAVAAAALAAGASIVNDIAASRRGSGADENPGTAMWESVARFGAGYIVMHSQGDPATMQDHPVYADVTREVGGFFEGQLARLVKTAGIRPEQVVLDPGIGFGKTLAHNLELLARLRHFTRFGRPLLVGVSRKSFIGKIFDAEVNQRLPASLACATLAVAEGTQIIRTHDVAETVQTVRMAEAVMARSEHVD